MDFDTSWTALVSPGEATTYFSPAPLERPEPSSHYSGVSAWWLAELSRLAYRRSGQNEFLLGVGLEERRAFESRGIQATLIAAAGPTPPFPHFLVFRGTDSPRDWLWNLNVARDRAGSGEVHRGFNRALNQIWGQVEDVLAKLSGRIAYAGHSLGGALAVLAAGRRPADAVYTFGAPRVGDQAFVDSLRELTIFQVVNNDDLVARLPPTLSRRQPFRHAGSLHRIVSEAREANRTAPSGERRTELPTPFDSRSRILGPPRIMSDHAPVNYVAHLERLLPEASPRG